ncbi:Layilin Precursor [Triplophysa tibetana]|uniref:Thrombomodulin n=1 Tax=Triplophysa tibetana TaxID=1572043 RepID=A0A5A9NG97_9TELE|nr:Layilin Precursor [Triplophysa tibetana]
MREMLGMVMALVLLGLRPANANIGHCEDEKCFSIHANTANFSAASRACKDQGGNLMSVRTEQTSSALSDLLENSNVTGDFWLGLEYVDARCLDSTGGLKGYKWVTGDDTTHYSNWKIADAVCFSRCVSVSKNAQTWNERSCQEILQGYLCEYDTTEYCHPLGTNASYKTPFGFTSDNLNKIPSGSRTTAQPLGTRHLCVSGAWIQGPWGCEVFGGGCEHDCETTLQGHVCICPVGFKIDMNGVTCSQNDDPCARAGCAQECFSSGATFVCACGPGFQLHADGKACEDINECTDTSACLGAHKQCVNTLGSFKCQCAPGFEDNKAGACVDVDECASGPCEHNCEDTIGSYNCSCGEGFRQPKEDMHKCERYCPTFECPADCDVNNNAQCHCPYGFIVEDDTCFDIDECDSGSCDQVCENTPGSYVCSCEEGFRLIDNGICVKDEFEGSGTSDPFDSFTPTSRPPAAKRASLSAGSLLGIMVCTVISILLLVCLVHCVRKKMHHYDVYKGHDEIYDFQQVIIDKTTYLSYPNRYLKRET